MSTMLVNECELSQTIEIYIQSKEIRVVAKALIQVPVIQIQAGYGLTLRYIIEKIK